LTGATSTRGGGLAANVNGLIALTYNVPPSQPTISTPINNSVLDKDADTDIGFTYQDSDPGDPMSAFELQWRFGSGSWNTKSVTSGSTAYTLVQADSSFAAHDGEIVEMQVRVTDTNGPAVSDWSPSVFFTLHAKPADPVWSSLPIINAQMPAATFDTPDGAAVWRIRVFHDNGSGGLGTEMLLTSIEGVTQFETGFPTTVAGIVSNGVPPVPQVGGEKFVNGLDYHLLASYAHYTGVGGFRGTSAVWSDEVDTGPITCEIDAPLVPTLVLTPDDATASVTVAITNPGSDPHAPDYNIVFRQNLDDGTDEIPIATAVALNGSYVDHTPASWSTNRYRVVAYRTANGAGTSSA